MLLPFRAVVLLTTVLLTVRRNFVTQVEAADYLGITDRSIRNLISRGYLTGFKLPGLRAIRVDLNEVDALLQTIPAVLPKYRPQRRPLDPDRVPFHGHVVHLDQQGRPAAEDAVTEGGR